MRHSLISLVAAVMLLGCSDDGGTKTDSSTKTDASAPDVAIAEGGAPDSAGGTDAAAAVSFGGEVQPIFGASCTGGSCHGGASPKQGMSLEAGQAHAALVGVQATECASLKRVEAGDAAQSYLIQKLEGAGSCFTGARMPFGASALDSAKLATIRTWIDQGALDN